CWALRWRFFWRRSQGSGKSLRMLEPVAAHPHPASTMMMTTRRRLGAIIGVGVGLAGCDRAPTAPAELPPGQVAVGPGTIFALPAPATLQRDVEAQQLVTARYGKDTFAFEALVSVSPARLLAVVTDTLGRQAMSAAWDGRAMRVDKAPWAPPELKADNVIADIMLVHWPTDAIRAGL